MGRLTAIAEPIGVRHVWRRSRVQADGHADRRHPCSVTLVRAAQRYPDDADGVAYRQMLPSLRAKLKK